ncbi:hypothetical protein BU16DRAFT_544314 [Lophium mytilinum]|uniref:Uncharacterized protein n=1 Tax=Lophium mytilinum TaxID=390894 RepID=A0A6A6QCV8_9PEZI|nr:hypothetical protein BU16DRAFT_544314 [Lophium mytilinum]
MQYSSTVVMVLRTLLKVLLPYCEAALPSIAAGCPRKRSQGDRPVLMDRPAPLGYYIVEHINEMESNGCQMGNMLRASFENNGAEYLDVPSDGSRFRSEDASTVLFKTATPPPATLSEAQQRQQLLEVMERADALEAVDATLKKLIRTWFDIGV